MSIGGRVVSLFKHLPDDYRERIGQRLERAREAENSTTSTAMNGTSYAAPWGTSSRRAWLLHAVATFRK